MSERAVGSQAAAPLYSEAQTGRRDFEEGEQIRGLHQISERDAPVVLDAVEQPFFQVPVSTEEVA